MSKELDALKAQADKLTPKYARGKRYEFAVRPNWDNMIRTKKANTSNRISKLIDWCNKNCKEPFSYDGLKAGYSFQSRRDAMLFKLTWG